MSSLHLEKTRINNRFPITREGLPFIFIGIGLTSIFLLTNLLFLSIFAGLMTLFIIWFFRDPERKNDVHDKTVLTPADGKVIDIQHLRDSKNPLGDPAIKLSIFMSIFSVHVNRIPMSGRISEISYHPGRFFSANLDKASERNENNRITMQTEDGRKMVLVQIAGMIARRIVCWVKEKDEVRVGQRFGLIRFGSRVDIYLPEDSRISVQPSQKVKAGKTILGYLS